MITVDNEPDFDFDSGEYRAFFARFGLSPFQHPDWLVPFYRRLPAAAGQTPLILVGRDPGTGALRCVLPMLVDGNADSRIVTFAFLGVTDYACPVVDPAAFAAVSIPGDLERIVGRHSLTISPIHQDHREIWSKLLGCEPSPLHFGSHAVRLARPMAEWRRRTFGRALLGGLARKVRRLSELGEVRLEPVPAQDARAAIDEARQFRTGRFIGDPLQVPHSMAFYADVAETTNGLARTFRLTSGGSVVAVIFGLAHGKRFHYLVLACDYARFARYSPGLLVMDRTIQAWADEDGEVFDFTIGDEPFKATFGCIRTPMYAISAPPRGLSTPA